ncbi:gamma-glutamyltransferase [Amphritea sp. 1_MG-2023]|uniref:gamma-glutamyltransferase n=1 Tax=Amphritea sp. 1_MG-2023 TaxID=3062670 RepID=UPI0026E24B03|nr:gamma-glutamyltransferase [Amphritea sp. 1_MG-2023]MDO6565058.1 gamma-glutamyltransferase [Amphritea sp. 1_MG-2023]
MRTHFNAIIVVILAIFSSLAYAINEEIAPESATGTRQAPIVSAQHQLVVSAHPLATQAGYNVLQRGGSAVDAAVAVQAMLTLVEPQSSGIGGGAFMLYWDKSTQQLTAFDGRETAPAAADKNLFLTPEGTPINWWDAMVGGRSVGTPGVLAMLELSQQQYGKQPWASLFDDAINTAESGFNVSPRLHQLLASKINPGLGRYPEARQYFFTSEGEPLAEGHRLSNPALASSLRQIAQQGASALYQGTLGEQVIAAVKQATDNPGKLQRSDLQNYRAITRQAICRPFRHYRVCGFPPPTSGGITTLQIIKLMALAESQPQQSGSVAFYHLLTQASRLAYADRARYLADSDFIDVPVDALLDDHYLQQRSQLISPLKDMGQAMPGELPQQISQADDQSPELPSTSHFVIVDQWGNAVSMTSSIEMAFGSTLMAGGFLLNNQLTDFSFIAEKDGKPVANRVQANKRPRSSMSPIMVFDEQNQLVAALGSPGGSRIINYVAKNLYLKLSTDISLQAAFNSPHVVNRNGVTELEADTLAEQLAAPLAALGHQTKIKDQNSGLHGFFRQADGTWKSAIDPRREGSAVGD